MYIRSPKPSSEPNHDEVWIEVQMSKSVWLQLICRTLLGRIFLKDAEEDGQRFRVCVVCAVVDREEELKKGSECMKFICEVPNSTFDEFYTYNAIFDHIKKDIIVT
jgi:hypothetical protein